VGDAAVDEVDFADAAAERGEGGVDFGDHAARDDALGFEVGDVGGVQGGDESGFVFGVAKDATNIGKEDEFAGFEAGGEGAGGEVGVDVEGAAAFDFAGDGGDDGDELAGDGGLDEAEFAVIDFADPAEVAFHFIAEEDFGAGDADGFAAEGVQFVDDVGVDDAGEGLLDDFDGLFVGDAHAVDEAGFEAAVLHGFGDGFAAAVDDDGVDADGFEEDDVFEEGVDDGGVFHGTAADLDEEGAAAVGLHVGQGFEEDGSFSGLLGEGHSDSEWEGWSTFRFDRIDGIFGD
jgi:hypothetical protein